MIKGSLATCAFCAVLVAGHASATTLGSKEAPCDRRAASDRQGAKPKRCRVSLTFSPLHLAYPEFLVSSEVRLFDRLGIALDAGLGSFRSATVGQLGASLPSYPVGSFDFGLQLGPFVRYTRIQFPHEHSLGPPSFESAHHLSSPFYHDVEFARGNGRDALFTGGLVGGKFVAPGFAGPFRGLTVQSGFRVGYHRLLRRSRFDPHPEVMYTDHGFLSTVYFDVGWSF